MRLLPFLTMQRGLALGLWLLLVTASVFFWDHLTEINLLLYGLFMILQLLFGGLEYFLVDKYAKQGRAHERLTLYVPGHEKRSKNLLGEPLVVIFVVFGVLGGLFYWSWQHPDNHVAIFLVVAVLGLSAVAIDWMAPMPAVKLFVRFGILVIERGRQRLKVPVKAIKTIELSCDEVVFGPRVDLEEMLNELTIQDCDLDSYGEWFKKHLPLAHLTIHQPEAAQ